MCQHCGHVAIPAALDEDTSTTFADTTSLTRRTVVTPCGHRVEHIEDWTHWTGGVCAVRKDLDTGEIESAADPRRWSRAMGW